MNKKLVGYVVLFLIIAGAAYIIAIHLPSWSTVAQVPSGQAIPSQYSQLANGMSESAVLSRLGQPHSKSIYVKFEHKTPAEWARIESDVHADFSNTDAPVSSSAIREQLELTHRYHDTWIYIPTPNTTLTLYFDEDGKLLNSVSAILQKSPPKH